MLTIRLHRVGKRHQPIFRIVLAEKHKAPGKKYLEILGTYNPRNKEFKIQDQDRVKYWLKESVEVSPTVHNLFVEQGLIDGAKVVSWKPKRKPAAQESKAAQPAKPEGEAAPAEAGQEQAPEAQAASAPETPSAETEVEDKKEEVPA